jgi:hypothetical protein
VGGPDPGANMTDSDGWDEAEQSELDFESGRRSALLSFYWVRHGGAEDAIAYVRDCRERLPQAGEQGAHTVWAGPIPEPLPADPKPE